MNNFSDTREQQELKDNNTATATSTPMIQHMTPQMDAENKRMDEIKKALLEAGQLAGEHKFKEAAEILNIFIEKPKQYSEKALSTVRSKVSEINKLAIVNQIQSLILQVTEGLKEKDYLKANLALNSVDAKLNSTPSLHDDFSERLGFLHYDAARKYSRDKNKMTLHLEKSKEFGNQPAKDAIKKLSTGENPFPEENPNSDPLIYDIVRGKEFATWR